MAARGEALVWDGNLSCSKGYGALGGLHTLLTAGLVRGAEVKDVPPVCDPGRRRYHAGTNLRAHTMWG
jgi:hypothetical protein